MGARLSSRRLNGIFGGLRFAAKSRFEWRQPDILVHLCNEAVGGRGGGVGVETLGANKRGVHLFLSASSPISSSISRTGKKSRQRSKRNERKPAGSFKFDKSLTGVGPQRSGTGGRRCARRYKKWRLAPHVFQKNSIDWCVQRGELTDLRLKAVKPPGVCEAVLLPRKTMFRHTLHTRLLAQNTSTRRVKVRLSSGWSEDPPL